jgi:hypothetical protein
MRPSQALNKLLGTNVYESNQQLGGPEVMGGNGVSHLIVNTDFDAIVQIVGWLSFIPKDTASPLPCLPMVDPVDRPVEVYPSSGTPYDPRDLLCGTDQEGKWVSGLLDKASRSGSACLRGSMSTSSHDCMPGLLDKASRSGAAVCVPARCAFCPLPVGCARRADRNGRALCRRARSWRL